MKNLALEDEQRISHIVSSHEGHAIMMSEERGAAIRLEGMSAAASYLAERRSGFSRTCLSSYAYALSIFAQIAEKHEVKPNE